MNPKVDAFMSEATKWQEEFKKLRGIVLDCGLTEELKWGQPCYTFQDKNVLLMHGFKDYSRRARRRAELSEIPPASGVWLRERGAEKGPAERFRRHRARRARCRGLAKPGISRSGAPLPAL
jgi:hypothetical protein